MFCKCCKKGLQFILTKTLALIPSCYPLQYVVPGLLWPLVWKNLRWAPVGKANGKQPVADSVYHMTDRPFAHCICPSSCHLWQTR